MRRLITRWRGSKILLLPCKYSIYPTKETMTTTSNNVLLHYLENTGLDSKTLYTPKERTERMRHYIKQIHDIDIKPALSGETIQTNNGWTNGRTIRDRNDHKRGN